MSHARTGDNKHTSEPQSIASRYTLVSHTQISHQLPGTPL